MPRKKKVKEKLDTFCYTCNNNYRSKSRYNTHCRTDKHEANISIEKMANDGYACAQYSLAKIQFEGCFTYDAWINTDIPEKWLLKSVGNGCGPKAEYLLGYLYYKKRDYSKAVTYLKLSAEKGYKKSCELLYKLYKDGKGTEKEYEKAVEEYEKYLTMMLIKRKKMGIKRGYGGEWAWDWMLDSDYINLKHIVRKQKIRKLIEEPLIPDLANIVIQYLF